MAIIPGKWQVFTLDSGPVVVRSTDGDAEYMVARCYGDGDGDQISTATLIAAAPELLRTLRFIVDDLSAMDLDANGWRTWDATAVDQAIAGALRLADLAIAKAEGRG